MEKFDYIVYPSRSIQTDGIKAFSVTSFGFGQKGAQAIGIHPKYLFATLDQGVFEKYRVKVEARQKKAYRYFHDGFINNTMFRAKDKAPYEEAQSSKVFLDPTARVTEDAKTASYKYPTSQPKPTAAESKKLEETRSMVSELAKLQTTDSTRVGVDVELTSAVNIDNETFVTRNFTAAERKYCQKAANPRASFAGRWSAKEAVFKSLGVKSAGGGAALLDIEIGVDSNGAPTVVLHGDAKVKATKAGVKNVTVSISHTDDQAVAIAVSHH